MMNPMNNLKSQINNPDENISENALNNAVSQMLDYTFEKELRAEIPRRSINSNTNTLKIRRLIIGAMIGVAICMILFIGYKLLIGHPNLENLSTQYAHSVIVKHPGLTKGENDNSNLNAIKAFNMEDWESASRLFNGLEQNLENQYYEGVSRFYNKEYERAITIMKKDRFASSVYSEEVKWFLANAYIQVKDFDSGLRILESISKNEWKYDESRILREAIEKMTKG